MRTSASGTRTNTKIGPQNQRIGHLVVVPSTVATSGSVGVTKARNHNRRLESTPQTEVLSERRPSTTAAIAPPGSWSRCNSSNCHDERRSGGGSRTTAGGGGGGT